MAPFIHENFLLETPAAASLYHDYAEAQPIIDYHCHLSPAEIAEDRHWDNISQIWLAGDHYKWRQMRTNGVPEKYCTGSASDWEKFRAYAGSMNAFIRNPLYHWTQLELKRYFGVDRLLNAENAKEIYEECNRVVRQKGFSARGLIARSNVRLICTTDDPTDDLRHHRKIAADKKFKTKVLPTWRPDKGMAVDKPGVFPAWVRQLEKVSGKAITSFSAFLAALDSRHAFFHAAGCRLADHGIDTFYAEDYTAREIDGIFRRALAGEALSDKETRQYKSAALYEFAKMNAKRGWVQQFHYGVIRNNNLRLFKSFGPDAGCDSIADFPVAVAMAKFLGRLDLEGKLAKSIFYNLNPRDNELVATMIGNFQDGSVAGKMQMGSGWWFLDQMDGMKRQIEALSQLGLLARFIGMLTDSRSFLSYTRHEYFRRILCNILGGDMERGLIPNDLPLIGEMVKNISYENARNYLGIKGV
ncbi:MAG: glucuronate isomerase [Planctomycetes bacterium]|nr:glucuronate isomerase [Planctomycetota bacterium]